MKMKSQPGASFTSPGVDVFMADENGLVDMPDDLAVIAKSHGFEEWVEPPARDVKIVEVEKSEDPNAEPVSVDDEFEMLNRNGLFAWLKTRDIAAPLPQSNDSLRALCRAAKANASTPAP